VDINKIIARAKAILLTPKTEWPVIAGEPATVADLYKPYLKGTELEADKNGFAAMHWPGYVNMSTLVGSMYVSKDVATSGRKLP